jgi:hypothetical protein
MKTLHETHGDGRETVMFWCPGCETHHAVNVKHPTGERPVWQWNGDRERPTFAPSVLVTYDFGEERTPKRCHIFVRDGRIEYLSDCTHQLAGTTIEMEDMP